MCEKRKKEKMSGGRNPLGKTISFIKADVYFSAVLIGRASSSFHIISGGAKLNVEHGKNDTCTEHSYVILKRKKKEESNPVSFLPLPSILTLSLWAAQTKSLTRGTAPSVVLLHKQCLVTTISCVTKMARASSSFLHSCPLSMIAYSSNTFFWNQQARMDRLNSFNKSCLRRTQWKETPLATMRRSMMQQQQWYRRRRHRPSQPSAFKILAFSPTIPSCLTSNH